MPTIWKEIALQAPADRVWAAIRDVGAIHTRLARDFVIDTRLDGDFRLVTFANGAEVRERIITIDDERRRLAYAVVGWQTTYHSSSFQVHDEGGSRSRVVWIADILPADLTELVDGLMEQGSMAIRQTLEASAKSATSAGR